MAIERWLHEALVLGERTDRGGAPRAILGGERAAIPRHDVPATRQQVSCVLCAKGWW